MFRFMFFIWDTESPAQCASARSLRESLRNLRAGWQSVYTDEGCEVFCVGVPLKCCSVGHGSAGIVLGTIFSRATNSACLSLSDSERILSTAGQHLIDAYWGSFVAVLRDSQSRRTQIVRSPCGALQCLMTRWRGVHVGFSLTADCAALRILDCTINWNYVAQHLTRSVSTEETGFRAVSQVRWGEGVEIAGDSLLRTHYWNPALISSGDNIEDKEEGAIQLRATAKASIHAWASSYECILHLLSGGLDSSIVLGCLKDAPNRPRIVSVNHHFAGSNSDERQFARLAAGQAECELNELEYDATMDLSEGLDAPICESPLYSYWGGSRFARFPCELARGYEAGAVFSGDRGDELFGSSVRFGPSDYVSRHGIRFKLFELATYHARARNLSVWKVLRETLKVGLTQQRWNILTDARDNHVLLNHDLLADLERRYADAPPWYLTGALLPQGKQQHIARLMPENSYYYRSPQLGDPQPINPLLSQPLVELCLRIPTYVLNAGGRSRGLARSAFSPDVPPEILRRYAKGGVGELVFEILDRNAGFMRDLLLNGALVREGLLDGNKVEEVLSGRPSSIVKGQGKLTHYLQTEIWLAVVAKNDLRLAA